MLRRPVVLSTAGKATQLPLGDLVGPLLDVTPYLAAYATPQLAMQAALATGLNVYVPASAAPVHLTATLTLGAGQFIVGDDRTTSTFTVGPDFSTTATAIITGSAGVTCGLRNMGIVFSQPALGTNGLPRSGFQTLAAAGGTNTAGIKYPWAIDFSGTSRPIISGVRLSGAWDGIKLLNNGAGGAYLDNIENGSADIGLYTDASYDFGHIKAYHSWPFGWLGTNSASVPPYNDGATVAANFGEVDGLAITDFSTFQGSVNFLGDTTFVGIGLLHMDGDGANLTVAAGSASLIRVASFYSTKSANAAVPLLNVAGGVLAIGQCVVTAVSALAASVQVSGGTCIITGGSFASLALAQPGLNVSGGTLILRGLSIDPYFTGTETHSYPLVVQSSTGVLDMQGCKITTVQGGPTATAVAAITDNAANVIANNDFGGWALSLPGAGASLGTYSPNGPTDRVATKAYVQAQIPVRITSATADTPTAADNNGVVNYTANAAITVTVNDLGAGRSYAIQQQGTGQVTIVAGSGVTLISDKATASFKSARRGAMLGITTDGGGNAYVTGNTA